MYDHVTIDVTAIVTVHRRDWPGEKPLKELGICSYVTQIRLLSSGSVSADFGTDTPGAGRYEGY